MTLAPLTGGAVNPARAAGPAIAGGDGEPVGDFLVAYVLGPVVGALLAGVVFGAIVLGRARRASAAEPEPRPVDMLD